MDKIRLKTSSFVNLLPACVLFLAIPFALNVLGEDRQGSLSMGNPNDGKLVRGVAMPEKGKGFFSNPHRTNTDAKYGTDELVEALVKVGRDIATWAPGATLVINDLGFQEGGVIPRHQSHQAGRDVDLLFYMIDEHKKALNARAYKFDKEGRAEGTSGGRQIFFDTPRNWMVLKSILLNEKANLQRVFVAEHLRKMLLEHAKKVEESPWMIERAGEAMCEPAVPHDDHYHIRLFCTAEDYKQGCRDSWPIYPWRRTELAGVGIVHAETGLPRPIKRSRRRRRRAQRRRTPGRTWCP